MLPYLAEADKSWTPPFVAACFASHLGFYGEGMRHFYVVEQWRKREDRLRNDGAEMKEQTRHFWRHRCGLAS